MTSCSLIAHSDDQPSRSSDRLWKIELEPTLITKTAAP